MINYSMALPHHHSRHFSSWLRSRHKLLLKRPHNKGFTIVELLIVIVVIGILATITIVAFNGIQTRARTATILSDLNGSVKTLELANVTGGAYPATLLAANLRFSSGTSYSYNYNTGNNVYCLSATNGTTTYSVTTSSTAPQIGDCTTAGLVGWWKLNGNANDSSTGGNNGIVTSATLATGQNTQANGAYAFNGTTSTIFTTIAPIAVTNITMSGWGLVQPGVTKGTIVHVGGGDGYSIGIGSNLNTTDNVVVGLFPGVRWVATTSTVTAGWHLFTMALDLNGTPTIYLDGVSLGTYGGIAASKPTAQISLGRNLGDEPVSQADRSYNSSIDDVRVYNRMLSTTEILALYNTGT
jgi:prepilin-type N-terminal cleavage/methylation domain-containing protein